MVPWGQKLQVGIYPASGEAGELRFIVDPASGEAGELATDPASGEAGKLEKLYILHNLACSYFDKKLLAQLKRLTFSPAFDSVDTTFPYTSPNP